MWQAPRTSDISAFACWSCSRGTSWGSRLAMARERPSPRRRPWTALSTTSIQISAVPVITSSAIAALGEAGGDVGDLEDQRAREPVGDHAAPEQEHHHRDVWAASTWPSAVAESVISSTANASATPAIMLPSVLTKREREVPAEVPLAKRGHRVLPLHAGHPTTVHETMVKRLGGADEFSRRQESHHHEDAAASRSSSSTRPSARARPPVAGPTSCGRGPWSSSAPADW